MRENRKVFSIVSISMKMQNTLVTSLATSSPKRKLVLMRILALAVMWFFTSPVMLALVPYFIYSVFHVVTYFSEYVLPAITSRPARPQEDKLAQLARKYQDTGSQTVAKVEVYGILIRLLLGVLSYSPPPQPPIFRRN